MPTLENIYKDVNSQLTANDVNTEQIYHNDVVKAINDSIRSLRREYVMNGLVEDFLYTESVVISTKDTDYPFVYSQSLTNDVIQDVPISIAVAQSVVYDDITELTDTAQSWTAGDLGLKGDYVYEALEDISSENTYELTFAYDKVRNYSVDNGLTYYVDDIIKYDGSYYKCDSEYVNNQSETPSASGNFTKLLWKQVDYGYQEGSFVPFSSMYESKLSNEINNSYIFSIKDNTVYTTQGGINLGISYVPEWTQVTDLSSELSIPDSMVERVKISTIQYLANKLNVTVQLRGENDENS